VNLSTGLAVIALLLGAIAILPGTLGVVMITRKLAATAPGARLIYGHAKWAALLSIALMLVAIGLAAQNNAWSVGLGLVFLAFCGVLVFGFLMHVGLNFKPVRTPHFISGESALKQLGADEEIIGVIDATGKPYAFITRLARRPHVVYQPSGKSPFIMSHCILAHSSMAYETKGDFASPDLQVVAVIANNMVFYDKKKECAVIQIQNQSRQGALQLETLSTVAASLGTWLKLYPESSVWIRKKEWRDTFYLKLLSRADVIDPASPAMIYSTEHELDDRLPMKSQVLGLQIGAEHCAYPVSIFQDTPVINDKLGGRPVLIASAFKGDFVQIFEREIESGQTLKFAALDTDDGFTDSATGSVWNPTGLCTAGELKDQQLVVLPHYSKIFWFVWADFKVNTRIYSME
jgi:hypothetical protein